LSFDLERVERVFPRVDLGHRVVVLNEYD